MGLDVSLMRCTDRELADKQEKEFDIQTEGLWHENMTGAEKDTVRDKEAQIAQELGTDPYGQSNLREEIDLPSALYPDHMFHIGYFRSSYNPSGINSIARRSELPSLYDIFINQGDKYEFQPDWESSLELVDEALVKWKRHDGFDVEAVYSRDLAYGPVTEGQALDIFAKQREDSKPTTRPDGTEFVPFREFSCRDGQFYLDGTTVYALIPGRMRDVLTQNMQECTYVIYKREMDFYIQSLEIVKETIEYVLSQPDPENYYLRWSS